MPLVLYVCWKRLEFSSLVKNYREAYDLYACNGILFNHESPIRGETFVTRKISRAAARISLGMEKSLFLGNLDAKRDWGHAKEYVEGMWLMLQQDQPEDFVLATGETHSVREFATLAFNKVGIEIEWQGKGIDEKGINKASGEVIIQIDPRYFRPTEVELLVGDPSKAHKELGWKHHCSFKTLVEEMVESDLELFKKDKYLMDGGHNILQQKE
jgi:GDPmannose 4,6-dehydratase